MSDADRVREALAMAISEVPNELWIDLARALGLSEEYHSDQDVADAVLSFRAAPQATKRFPPTHTVEITNQGDHYSAALLSMGGTLIRVGRAENPTDALTAALTPEAR